ncbi:MAG: aldehyde reductase [Leptospiraceae bacterium]|nr:aldehyde reductase [Leptospiraceae bacterium]
MEWIDKEKPVLVTGASGYIASWIIKYLLEEGYTVHGTVRNINKKDTFSHLLDIAEKSSGNLKIFQADLMKKESFLESMQGVELVIHTASPFVVRGINNPKQELIEPALEGTRNVLNSANQIPTVKRIVLTSSTAAIYGDNIEVKSFSNGIVTEEYWNTSSNIENNPYSYSKTLAEKEAWEISKQQNRWDLVVINPCFVFGPSLTKRNDSTSIQTLIQLGNGTFRFGVPELWFGITDVRDVAKAHILAGTKKEASGRHILYSDSLPMLEIANILHNRFGDKYLFPRNVVPYFLIWLLSPIIGLNHKYVERNVEIPIKMDNSYTKKDLGLEPTPVEKTFVDHFEQLIKDKLV